MGQRVCLDGQGSTPYRTLSRTLVRTTWFRFALCFALLRTCVESRDACDWTGSGLDLPNDDPSSTSRVVRPLYLRCNQGKIKWSYPLGALRLLLKLHRGTSTTGSAAFSTSLPPEVVTEINAIRQRQKDWSPSTSAREFRGCIRVEPGFEGARIYLEGDRKLHLLHAGRADPRPLELVRCFVSVRGRAALYVEAEPDKRAFRTSRKHSRKNSAKSGGGGGGRFRKRVAAFSYDLQAIGQETYDDEFKECRPCTEEEMLQNYCTSDFVVKGTVTTLYHNTDFDRSELTIKASKVLRDHVTRPIFIGSHVDQSETSGVPVHTASPRLTSPAGQLLDAAYAQFEAHFQDKNGSQSLTSVHYGVLQRPLKCGTKVGQGEFLFMGRLTLGNPRITCAPRIGDWKKIRRKAVLAGTNQCNLD